MNRRKFLQWIGFGAAVAAVPAVAATDRADVLAKMTEFVKAMPPITGAEILATQELLRGELGQSVGFKIITSDEGPAIEWIRARDFYAPADTVAAHTIYIDGKPHYMLQVHPKSWLGEQWTEAERAKLWRANKPPLVLNRIAT